MDCTGTFVIARQYGFVAIIDFTHTRVPLLHSFLNLIMFTDDPLATHKNRDKYLHNCLYCEQHSHRVLIHCLVPKIVSNSQEAAYSSGFPLLALQKQITENGWGKAKNYGIQRLIN